MKRKRIDPERFIGRPTTLKLEMAVGCNLRCTFCPVHYDPSFQVKAHAPPRTYMHPSTVSILAAQYRDIVPDKQKVELASRGEPTLNPELLDCLATIRSIMPRAQVSLFTNGTRLFKDPEYAIELLDAGANIVNVECYNGTYGRLERLLSTAVTRHNAQRVDGSSRVVRMADFATFSAYRRHAGGARLRVVNLIPDVATDTSIRSRALHNWAGNVPDDAYREYARNAVKQFPMERMCTKPFRELVVYQNGDVPICCLDWHGEAILGNAFKTPLRDIWYGVEHLELMRAMFRRDRSGNVCNRCSEKSGFHMYQLRNPYTGGRWSSLSVEGARRRESHLQK